MYAEQLSFYKSIIQKSPVGCGKMDIESFVGERTKVIFTIVIEKAAEDKR